MSHHFIISKNWQGLEILIFSYSFPGLLKVTVSKSHIYFTTDIKPCIIFEDRSIYNNFNITNNFSSTALICIMLIFIWTLYIHTQLIYKCQFIIEKWWLAGSYVLGLNTSVILFENLWTLYIQNYCKEKSFAKNCVYYKVI